MVHHQVLDPDGRKAIPAVVADALGEADVVGGELELGPVDGDELCELVQGQHAVDAEAEVGRKLQLLGHEEPKPLGHVDVEFEPDHRAAPAAFKRRLEQ